MNKLQSLSTVYVDWYSKHKVGSRLAMIVFIVVYVVTALYPLLKNVKANDNIFIEILHTTSWIALVAFITTVVGANTLVRLAEIYRDIKIGKSNSQEKGDV